MLTKLFYKCVLLLGPIVFITSCAEENLQELNESESALPVFQVPSDFTEYFITAEGIYEIRGTVRGEVINLNNVPDGSTIIIRGVGNNPLFEAKPYTGPRANDARSKSHIRGGFDGGSLTIEDFAFFGRVNHNFMSLPGNCNKIIQDLFVTNDTRDGAGGINPGTNSLVRRCTVRPHDDAIKPTEPNARAENCTLIMGGNGAALQLGWGQRAGGAIHYATDITIRGYLTRNKQTNTDSNPGRAVIGGIYENNGSDVQFTGLDIDMDSNHTAHYVKLKADGATLRDVTITGMIHNTVNVDPAIHAVALNATNGGQIQNMVLDLGPALTNSDIFMTNNVDLTFTRNGSGGGSSCSGDPAPSGSILTSNLNANGDGRVSVAASDNGQITRVEVFEGGSQSRGFLTAPNSGANYRIVSADLDAGDSYTVVITDDCSNTTTLNGVIDGGAGGPCASDPSPTASIVNTNYNAGGDGRVVVAASDNGSVVSVEVLKGSTSMGIITTPNAGVNYRVVNSDLNPGDSFTVAVTDDCGNVTTLNGTMP